MAYLRSEKESFEIDYPIEKVWDAIPDVIKYLNWTIEEKDDQRHTAKLKSKPGFLAFATTLLIEASFTDNKTSKMTINAETPVTTITSMADFGRTRDRLDQFVDELAKEMERRSGKPKDEQKI
jgi:carbon monoxide dehydrogenase subunit G